MEEKQKGIFACYGKMWKRLFDFKGLTTVREYWLAFLVHAVLALLLAAAAFFSGLTGVCLLFVFYLVATVVPFTALSVRRLHDGGWSGWWVVLVYVGIGLVLCVLTVGTVQKTFEPPVCVYGPPSNWEVDDNRNVTMYGPPPTEEPEEWRGEDNINPAVYGPPPTEELKEWKEEDNINVDVYGPPEWFE